MKKLKNSCCIKVSKQLLEIARNAINQLKIHLELNWIGNCILSSAGNSAKSKKKKKKTDAKLHVPLVTLSTKDNVNLTKKN